MSGGSHSTCSSLATDQKTGFIRKIVWHPSRHEIACWRFVWDRRGYYTLNFLIYAPGKLQRWGLALATLPYRNLKVNGGIMEQRLPIEEIAKQRLKVLVNAYTLFVKNLKDEGVELEKVKAASDKTWAALGVNAGQEIKEFYKDVPTKDALFSSGSIVSEVHAMEVKEERSDTEKHVEVHKCPWNEAAQTFDVPPEWRLCKSGHEAFSATMLQTIEPSARFEMPKSMPAGDPFCDERVTF